MKSLTKEYQFKNFVEALDFVNHVGRIAEKRDHHPDIQINYSKVTLTFYTHTENKVTEKDTQLAEEIDGLIKLGPFKKLN